MISNKTKILESYVLNECNISAINSNSGENKGLTEYIKCVHILNNFQSLNKKEIEIITSYIGNPAEDSQLRNKIEYRYIFHRYESADKEEKEVILDELRVKLTIHLEKQPPPISGLISTENIKIPNKLSKELINIENEIEKLYSGILHIFQFNITQILSKIDFERLWERDIEHLLDCYLQIGGVLNQGFLHRVEQILRRDIEQFGYLNNSETYILNLSITQMEISQT